MSKQFKAIETKFDGYHFRSRLEARWAVFFKTLGIPYEYEKEGFDLDGVWYLPDFYLPGQRHWLEIKPSLPSKSERNKAIDLAIATQKPVVILAGNVWNDVKGFCFSYLPDIDLTRSQLAEVDKFPHKIHWITSDECMFLDYQEDIAGADLDIGYMWSKARWKECPSCNSVIIWSPIKIPDHNPQCKCSFKETPRIIDAYTAARQARFEYGGK